jgi:hypothetical protein
MSYYNSNRGGYRGRGRGRGNYSYPYVSPDTASSYGLPQERDMMEGLSATPVDTLDIPSLALGQSDFTGTLITDIEYVASYNWTDAKEPTIIVPGELFYPKVFLFICVTNGC